MSPANERKVSMDALAKLAQSLQKEIADAEPSLERCQDLISATEKEGSAKIITIEALDRTKLGKIVTKAVKHFRRVKRHGKQADWQSLQSRGETLLEQWKQAVAKEESPGEGTPKATGEADGVALDGSTGLPTSQSAYRARLTKQKKELYKDPPELPPPPVKIESEYCGLPKRDSKTASLTFECGKTSKHLGPWLQDFHPNRTPEEILRAGAFGGTYFRSIASAVTNQTYSSNQVLKDTVPDEWIAGLDRKSMLTSATYRENVNKYGSKCGGSLGMWESSGWITDVDPYGWFQWYCRFYQGRRSSDDQRQISRWLKNTGPKGRFRSQLCNKILAANTRHDDTSISPVIRQNLLHWGLEITPEILEAHRKRTGK
jgi:hypothetical protein